jgi:hypothetical protein
MSASFSGGFRREGVRQERHPAADAERPAETPRAPGGRHRWSARVEALAARWQAALGGFHDTGAPPNRD